MKFISTIAASPPEFMYLGFEKLQIHHLLSDPVVILHENVRAIVELLGEHLKSFCGIIVCYSEAYTTQELHAYCWVITVPESQKLALPVLLQPMLKMIEQCLAGNSQIEIQKIKIERANRVISELRRDYQEITGRLVGQLNDLQAAKDLLALSQSHIRQIINLMPQHVFAVDSTGQVLLCNEAFALSFGLGAEVVVQRNIGSLDFGEQWTKDSAAADAWVNQHQRRYDLSETWRMIGEEKRYFRLIKIPYQYGDSEQLAILTVADDITRQHQFEQEIVSLNQKLEKRVAIRTQELAKTNEALLSAKLEAERASQTKSLFLATMSHELRTPMNAVIGLLEIFEGDNLSEEQNELLDNVVNSAKLLLSILNDILDLSKIEAGKIEIDYHPFCLPDVVKRVIQGMENLANQKDISLDYDIGPTVPNMLIGDEVRLRQILYNLCSNAIKFTRTTVEKKGQVNVSVYSEPFQLNKSRITMRVTDNGIGMDVQTQTKIFQPFSQADASTTRRYGGTGLGLSICKQLITLLGGDIFCESEQGVGTTFTCQLPMAHASAAATHARVNSEPIKVTALPDEIRHKTILVAEDNAVNRLVFYKQLKKLGIDAVMVNDGQAALAYWQVHPVDLIFTDCNMPSMDGFELTKIIRAQEFEAQLPETPIVAVTANALKGEAEKCFAAKMNDYLTKPVNLSQLKAIILKYGEKK